MPVFKVSENNKNVRADVFLSSKVTQLSRSSLAKLFKSGKVLINKQSIKPSQQLREGQKIVFDFDINKLQEAEQIDLPILYEDENVIVIDKPSGILTHSKGELNTETTVATFIKPKLNGLSGARAGIVHRLDRDTSGVIICAKNDKTSKWLQKQFSTRKVVKTYLAVVKGHLKPLSAVIDMPIERNPNKPQTFRVGENGKQASTKYKTLKELSDRSLVELKPKTGRTHQLRVHMKTIGNPIVGDRLYGGEISDRLYLHAKSLNIKLPSGDTKVFESKVPKSFNASDG